MKTIDIDLPANTTKTLLRYIKPGRFRSSLTVRVRRDDEVLCERIYLNSNWLVNIVYEVLDNNREKIGIFESGEGFFAL